MGKYWVGFTYDMDLLGNSLLGFIMIFWRGEGSRRAGAGLRFAEEWEAEEILDQVGSRLSAGRSHQRVTAGTPARRGGYFSVMKSRQKNFI